MKVKNLNLAERYIEWLVLALGIVFSLFVVSSYLVGAPYQVEVTIRGQKRTMTPVEMEKAIVEVAQRVEADVRRDDLPDELRNFEVPAYMREMREMITTASSVLNSASELGAFRFQTPLAPEIIDVVAVAQRPYMEITPPTPDELEVAQGFGVLAEPSSDAMVRAYENLIGSDRPRDFRWVSVAASFDLESLRETMRTSPSSGEFQPLPEGWWRGGMLVTDVILERQRLNPLTGRWGEIERLPRLPDAAYNFRNPQTSWLQQEALDVRRALVDHQPEIARPRFADLAEGFWIPPSVDLDRLPPNVRSTVEGLERQIRALQRRVQAEREASELGGGASAEEIARAREAIPDLDLEAGTDRPGAQASQRDASTQSLEQVVAQRDAAVRRLYGVLGFRPSSGDPSVGSPSPDRGRPSGTTGEPMGAEGRFLEDMTDPRQQRPRPSAPTRQPTPSPSRSPSDDGQPETQEITVWAHDVTVQPGAIYRYRVLVSVLNPLFHRPDLQGEQRERHFNQLSITSPPSRWTSDVRIESDLEFYIVRADRNAGTATVEVYGVFNGRRMVQAFEVAAGDPIGGVVERAAGEFQRAVDLRVNTVLVDVNFGTGQGTAAGAKVVILDRTTGELVIRDVREDTGNLRRLRLEREVNQRDPVAQVDLSGATSASRR